MQHYIQLLLFMNLNCSAESQKNLQVMYILNKQLLLHCRNYLANYYFAASCIHDITSFVRGFYDKIYLDNVSGIH